ncbi:MAG: hypothetical protein GY841_14600 [FCB group bacterium]|nr:hypothetical protein [FCB group bacterium]
MTKILMITCFCMLSMATGIKSQEGCCDPQLDALSGSTGYAIRGSGNRCEGIYKRNTGSHFEIVSILFQKLNYDLANETILKVSTPEYDSTSNDTIHIRAYSLRENPNNYYYRMDGYFVRDDILLWPVGDVLEPLELSDKMIGLFGWLGTYEDRLYIPLSVQQQSDSDPTADFSKILLKVRWSVGVEQVKWKIIGDDQQENDWMVIAESSLPPLRPVTIGIPSGPSGPVKIKVAVLRNGSWPSKTIELMRP